MPEVATEKVAVCPAVIVWLAGCVVIVGATAVPSHGKRGAGAGDAARRIRNHHGELRPAVANRFGGSGIAGRLGSVDTHTVQFPLVAEWRSPEARHRERLPSASGNNRLADGLRCDCGRDGCAIHGKRGAGAGRAARRVPNHDGKLRPAIANRFRGGGVTGSLASVDSDTVQDSGIDSSAARCPKPPPKKVAALVRH